MCKLQFCIKTGGWKLDYRNRNHLIKCLKSYEGFRKKKECSNSLDWTNSAGFFSTLNWCLIGGLSLLSSTQHSEFLLPESKMIPYNCIQRLSSTHQDFEHFSHHLWCSIMPAWTALCGWLLADTFHKHFMSFRKKKTENVQCSQVGQGHIILKHMWLWAKIIPGSKARHVFRGGVSWFKCMCPHAFVSKWWVWSRHSPAWMWPTVQFYSVLVMRVCTCIRALSTSQRRWRGGYIDSFCRSRTSTQGRGLACWPGKPHPAPDCPVACSDHWGVRPSCSLRAENEKRIQRKILLNYSETSLPNMEAGSSTCTGANQQCPWNITGCSSICTDQTNHYNHWLLSNNHLAIV